MSTVEDDRSSQSSSVSNSSASTKSLDTQTTDTCKKKDEIQIIVRPVDATPILVRDLIPMRVWVASIVGMTERAAYYSSIVMIQNYVQNDVTDALRPGILGLGQAKATQIQFAFVGVMSVTPVAGACIADSRLGRHKTMLVTFPFFIIGLLVLCILSFNTDTARSGGVGALLMCLLLLAIGSGGIKANVNAFIGDQYVPSTVEAFREHNGTDYEPDHALTLQHIYSVYYWLINIGSLAGIGTTLLEAQIGFGFAFLVPLILITLGFILFVAYSRSFVKRGPAKGNLTHAFAYASHNVKQSWSKRVTKKSNQLSTPSNYDAQFSRDMKTTWKLCRIFATFTFAWLCWDQGGNNFISQAGQMHTSGIPNDMFYFLNPILVIVLLPIFEKWIYPFLRSRGAKLDPITRMLIGHVVLTASMVYAAVLQHIIYSKGPCYEYPRFCEEVSRSREPNAVSAFMQVPLYLLQSVAEIFSQIAAIEYAFGGAPENMKSIMQAIMSSFGSVGSLLGVAMAPASKDPWMVYVYSSLAGGMAVTAACFWLFFVRCRSVDMISEASSNVEVVVVQDLKEV
ncbi:POT family-domain-containing protein [Phaeosphaeria sp. MPI-PUGE-AT-0046c]|nr:POT family-domain-containing protein [Phaeosphaeria sp. MPI-PUGE-AT-0046c]